MNLNKGISTPIAIVIIVVVAVLAGGAVRQYKGIEKTKIPQEVSLTADDVIAKVKENYSGLENFVATVKGYKGRVGQTREEMVLRNKFKFYLRIETNDSESYTQLIEKGASPAISTYEPLGMIAVIYQYGNLALTGEDRLDGRAAYILEFNGESPPGEAPPRWKIWIDKNKWVVLRQEKYYIGELLESNNYNYSKIGNYWLPQEVESNHYYSGNKIINIRTNYEVNASLPTDIIDELR